MEWVGKIPPTFKGNGFFTWFPLSCHSPDPNFSSRFGKKLHQKQRGWCELISVVGGRIVVGTYSPIYSFGVLLKVKNYFTHFDEELFLYWKWKPTTALLLNTWSLCTGLFPLIGCYYGLFLHSKGKRDIIVSNSQNTLGPKSQQVLSTSWTYQFFNWWNPGRLYWVPCPHRDSRIGSMFRKFYLLKTSFTSRWTSFFGESV